MLQSPQTVRMLADVLVQISPFVVSLGTFSRHAYNTQESHELMRVNSQNPKDLSPNDNKVLSKNVMFVEKTVKEAVVLALVCIMVSLFLCVQYSRTHDGLTCCFALVGRTPSWRR